MAILPLARYCSREDELRDENKHSAKQGIYWTGQIDSVIADKISLGCRLEVLI